MKNKKKLGLIIFLLLIGYFIDKISTLKKQNFLKIESQKITIQEKYVYISLDDTIELFKDLKKNNYKNIFENKTLNYLRKLNKKYGAKVTLYVCFENDGFKLTEVSTNYKNQFEENKNWLKFGFHSQSFESDYSLESSNLDIKEYEKVINQLEKIVGNKSIDKISRVHLFAGNKNMLKKLREKNLLIGLLGADDNRKIYYLDDNKSLELKKNGELYDQETNLYFIATDIRGEKMKNILLIKELVDQNKDKQLIIFTHEWSLGVINKMKLKLLCYYSLIKNYKFEYPQNYVGVGQTNEI